MDKTRRLPIKVITPSSQDWSYPKSGGGKKKLFRDIDATFRRELADQVRSVQEYFSRSFADFPTLPAVAVVKLHDDALAKTHCPDSLFRSSECPIIGSRRMGELLIGVQSGSLSRLVSNILRRTTKTALANLSTILEITPYTSKDALQVAEDYYAISDGKGVTLKLKPFKHPSERANQSLRGHLRAVCEKLDLGSPAPLKAYGHATVYRLAGLHSEQVASLASFVGTRSLAAFPRYRVLRTASRRLGPATPAIFGPPEDARDYPVLGIVDSGIDPNSTLLAPWVVARMWAVAATDCDHGHGTFVGALAVHARPLNNQNPCFPSAPCKLVDIVAFPASGELPEDELVQAIEEALRAHPEVRVWNLSLSSNVPCSDIGFSDLGMALDELSDEFGVVFIIAAGNYATAPFRGWPAEDLGEDDRIGSPGDSVRSLTVGSLAHLESASARVRRNQPSPFSRRGPGPGYLPKPEVAQHGGNCDSKGNCMQIGVISVDGSGYLAEDIGTSYATVLVASSLATIFGETEEKPSSNLAKALLIHSAVLGSDRGHRESERAYFGFGVPGAVEEALSCTNSSVTLVFEPELHGANFFEKTPFPFPECLHHANGAAYGDVMMTLVYDPPLDTSWGLEYCRANVEVSLGSFDPDKKGKREQKRLVPPDETDYRKMYERELIRNGFKWSPVKVYRKRLHRVAVETWRLTVTAEFRKGFAGERLVKPALVITISDPAGELPVYNQVVRAAQQQGWIIHDLRLRQKIRVAPTPSAA